MKLPLLLGALICAVNSAGLAHAKCARILLRVKGELVGGLNGSERVVLDVSPEPRMKQEPVKIEGNSFSGQLLFDPTSSDGRFGHECSRDPKTVTVTLWRGERLLEKQVLEVAKEYEIDERGRYRAKRQLRLNVDGKSQE